MRFTPGHAMYIMIYLKINQRNPPHQQVKEGKSFDHIKWCRKKHLTKFNTDSWFSTPRIDGKTSLAS